MAELKPFHGIRYSSNDLGDLVCPPYDVISIEEQARLHERDPHNAVHLELARDSDGGGQKYYNVFATFERWLNEGVLQQDDEGCLYVYRQDFVTGSGERGRVAGVIGALQLEELGADSGVLPHERTMTGPIEDRLALLHACPVNISPIYAIYRGGGALTAFFDSLEQRPPEARFTDEHHVLHRVWVIRAAAEIALLADAVRPGPLVIADGHHRYETALAYHRENRDRPGAHDAVMCFCVDADAEDLVVLPYHRGIKVPLSESDIASRLAARAVAHAVADDDGDRALRRSDADHPFLFVLPSSNLLVEVSDRDVVGKVGPRARAWRELDVVALHEALLPEVVPEGTSALVFSKDRDEIVRLVRKEGWSAGVLLRALDAVQVVEVARSGERMPQKASYFWPKAVTGLVFRSLR